MAAGAWGFKENQIYLEFLESNRDLFETEFKRRSKKVFRKMSSMLRRRDPEQCRSHHQKISNKFKGNTDAIVSYLKLKI